MIQKEPLALIVTYSEGGEGDREGVPIFLA
jgi:hypothetical protein